MEELEEEIKPQKLDDFKELDENLYRQSKKKRNYIILFSILILIISIIVFILIYFFVLKEPDKDTIKCYFITEFENE